MKRPVRRSLFALAATVALLAPLVWMWQASLVPGTHAVAGMGVPDYGGGPRPAGHHGTADRSLADLVADPDRPPEVQVTLTARQERFTLPSGQEIDGYTLNGSSPGPTIRAVQGQLIEVRLVNESVPRGVTLHWHGVDVPNSQDGVAGVTQDAVAPGQTFTYRFVAEDAGTYWYHAHQDSEVQVSGGLFGALVVDPVGAAPAPEALAVLHVYGGVPTINGVPGDVPVPADDGTRVRVRVVNTDNGATPVRVSGGLFRLLAVDGHDLHAPPPVSDRSVRLTAGGRVDLEVTAPARVEFGGGGAVVVGTGAPRADGPAAELDLLSYGSPAPLGFDPAEADRVFEYSVGRRPGFVDGRPGMWWSINGHLFPDVPMFHVEEGDVVRMRLANHSGEAHPMHLHGHHAVVLARDGRPATGSPWWVDSLDVANGESYDIAFVADNPAIWMDHCHNLPHASEGLVAHLMYVWVTSPFLVGGDAGNRHE